MALSAGFRLHRHACLLLALWIPFAAADARAQDGRDLIRLNQIGFYPDESKLAVVVDGAADAFLVRSLPARDTVLSGYLGAPMSWSASGETVRVADFTDVAEPGRYEVFVAEVGASHPFEVRLHVHEALARAAIKAFYFQRASVALQPLYAGVYSRPAGHPDTQVIVHASAATAERPAGTVISAPRGWYDAGDYNKYIVNSGISTSTLLSFLEHYPAYAGALETNIPESGDSVPDVLHEILWNVRWMLAMQDPHDGGVYHKLTHASFSGVVMPHQATAPRYVVEKSTAAALDFAAVMAQVSRILRSFEDELPGLADSTLSAAEDAWRWARRHPDSYYSQSILNAFFDPDIHTGEYGDGNVSDEFDWAAIELYITTGQDSFLTATNALGNKGFSVPGWPNVRALGYYSLLFHAEDVGREAEVAAIRSRMISAANGFRSRAQATPYRTTMESGDFYWGSNAVAANHGMLLVQAYRETDDRSYLDAAITVLDYLLGRNATAYSFVTGHGSRTPMHPHHRQSEADRVVAPVPGLLAGGPNADRQDGCSYPSTERAKSYVDSWCSYASNEIAINWNAPLFYLAAAIEAELSPTGLPVGASPEVVPVVPYESNVDVYPNPASGRVTIRFSLEQPDVVAIDLMDVQGRRVAMVRETSAVGPGRHEAQFFGDDLAAGLYFVRIRTSSGLHVRPLAWMK